MAGHTQLGKISTPTMTSWTPGTKKITLGLEIRCLQSRHDLKLKNGSGGCFVFGSRWHMASGKSKGKGKSFDSHGKSSRPWHPKGKDKGYGKSYGKYNKGKSFGKGKGFGKNRKGFGKGKYKQGLFSDVAYDYPNTWLRRSQEEKSLRRLQHLHPIHRPQIQPNVCSILLLLYTPTKAAFIQ